MQGAQHQLHSTSWYKNIKKLENIVNHDRKNDAYVKILEFSFLRYGIMKNQKLLFLTGYKKLRSLFV